MLGYCMLLYCTFEGGWIYLQANLPSISSLLCVYFELRAEISRSQGLQFGTLMQLYNLLCIYSFSCMQQKILYFVLKCQNCLKIVFQLMHVPNLLENSQPTIMQTTITKETKATKVNRKCKFSQQTFSAVLGSTGSLLFR